MRQRQRLFTAVEWVVVCMIVASVVGLVVLSYATCHSQWKRSGLEVSWGPIQGCMLGLPDGRWLPADRLREMDIQPRGGAVR